MVLLRAMLILWCPVIVFGQMPDCSYEGRVFGGDGSTGTEMVCNGLDNDEGAFSFAFTARLDVLSGGRQIIEFMGALQSSIEWIAVWISASDSKLHLQSCGGHPGPCAPSIKNLVALQQTYRILVTLSASGKTALYVDGVLVGDNADGYAFSAATRSYRIGASTSSLTSSVFNGLIEDVYVWGGVEVDWSRAVVPKILPVIIHTGRSYDSTTGDNFDTVACPQVGGSASIAFTFRWERTGNGYPCVLLWGNGYNHGDNYFIVAIHAATGGDRLYFGYTNPAPTQMLLYADVSSGETYRCLAVLSSTGYMQFYINGALASEGHFGFSSPVIPATDRTLVVASRGPGSNPLPYKGMVEDVWFFDKKVGWVSAVITTTTTTSTTSSMTSTTPTATSTGTRSSTTSSTFSGTTSTSSSRSTSTLSGTTSTSRSRSTTGTSSLSSSTSTGTRSSTTITATSSNIFSGTTSTSGSSTTGTNILNSSTSTGIRTSTTPIATSSGTFFGTTSTRSSSSTTGTNFLSSSTSTGTRSTSSQTWPTPRMGTSSSTKPSSSFLVPETTTTTTGSLSGSSLPSTSTTTTADPVFLVIKLLGIDLEVLERDGGERRLDTAKADFVKAVEDAIFSVASTVSGTTVKREEMYTRLEGKPDGVIAETAVPGLGAETAATLNDEKLREAVLKNVKALPGFDSLLLPGATFSVVEETTTLTVTWTATTTTILPSPAEAAEAMFRAVADNTKLLTDLRDGNETTLVAALPDGGTLAVTSLGDALLEASTIPEAGAAEGEGQPSRIHVQVPGTGVDVSLPLTMFPSLGVIQEVALVVAAFNSSTINIKGLGNRLDPNERGEVVKVAGAVVIDIRRLDTGKDVPVKGLADPIEFTLPVKFAPGMICSYWDEVELTWSPRGVTTVPGNVPDGMIKCQTTHLSMFGAIIRSIVQTVMCMNVLNIMNAEALREILQGSWLTSMGTAVLGSVFLVLFILFVAAAFLDDRQRKRCGWEDTFFMVYEEPSSTAALSITSTDTTSASGNRGAMIYSGLCACCLCLRDSDVLRQAVDDIISSWFEYFGELRETLETCIDTDLLAMGLGLSLKNLSQVTHKWAAKMTLMVSRHETAAKLGMDMEVVSFLLDDKDLANYIAEEGGTRSGADRRSKAEAWSSLREEVSGEMRSHIQRRVSRRPQFLTTLCKLCLLENPISSLFVHNIFCNCKQRVLTFSVELLGTFAVTCLFFEQSGMARGKKQRGGECAAGDDDDNGLDITKSLGRSIVISLGCLLVAGLPANIVSSLQTKGFKVMSDAPGSEAWARQLRAWRLQEVLVFAVGLSYNAFCTFYIVSFLANIGESDHAAWSQTSILALFQEILVLPFVRVSAMLLMARASLAGHLHISKVPQDQFMRKVCEIFQESTLLRKERL